MTETEEIVDKIKRAQNRLLDNYSNYKIKIGKHTVPSDRRGVYIIELERGPAIVYFNYVDMLPEAVRYLDEDEEVADDYYVKQVVLSQKSANGKLIMYTWIDEQFAVKGKQIELKDDKESGTWTVEKVYEGRVHVKYMRERARDHLRTRIASDI